MAKVKPTKRCHICRREFPAGEEGWALLRLHVQRSHPYVFRQIQAYALQGIIGYLSVSIPHTR